MAFERLQQLGEDRFQKILNDLMRGVAAMAVARMIQQEWGEFQDVGEKTLTQQVNRLRKAAAEGMFGKKLAKQVEVLGTPHIAALQGISVSVLDRLEEICDLQQKRVKDLLEKEGKLPVPIAALAQQTTNAISTYKDTLKDVQKIRFDLGLDELKAPVPMMGMRGSMSSTTLPDGTHIQKQVFEAVQVMEEIFSARKIDAQNP